MVAGLKSRGGVFCCTSLVRAPSTGRAAAVVAPWTDPRCAGSRPWAPKAKSRPIRVKVESAPLSSRGARRLIICLWLNPGTLVDVPSRDCIVRFCLRATRIVLCLWTCVGRAKSRVRLDFKA